MENYFLIGFISLILQMIKYKVLHKLEIWQERALWKLEIKKMFICLHMEVWWKWRETING